MIFVTSALIGTIPAIICIFVLIKLSFIVVIVVGLITGFTLLTFWYVKSPVLYKDHFFFNSTYETHTHTHTIRAGPPHVKIQVYFQDIITYQEIQQKNGCTLDSQIPTDHLALGIVLNAKFKSSISITFALGQEQQLEQTIFNVSNYLLQVFVCSFLLLSCL